MQRFSPPGSDKNRLILDVTLKGGPPWGFNLTGGSEFGAALSIKKGGGHQGAMLEICSFENIGKSFEKCEQKSSIVSGVPVLNFPDSVTSDKTAVREKLLDGDEILAVNGITVSSRANAIQMVKSVDHELTLKIRRYTTGHLEKTSKQNMKENSYYPPKLKSAFSDNNNGPNGNYKIVAINKENTSNKHSIRLAIPNSTSKFNEAAVDVGHIEKSVNSKTTQNVQSDGDASVRTQKRSESASTRVMPHPRVMSTGQSQRVIKSSSSTTHIRQRSLDQLEFIATDPLPNVSSSRALFERMNSPTPPTTNSNHNQEKRKYSSKSTSVMKNLRPFTTIDDPSVPANNATLQEPVISHQHTRSLPIEMASAEFHKNLNIYKQRQKTKIQQQTNKDNTRTNTIQSPERPKSAHYTSEETKSGKDEVNPAMKMSKEDILKSFRVKSTAVQPSRERLSDQHKSKFSSQSFEDITSPNNFSENSTDNTSSANELRQAASRYHDELRKHYPQFRHIVNDSVQKLPRKVSMPTDDPFSRGERHRATIATTSTSRLPRAHSTSDNLDIEGLPESYTSKSNENSMMSRLLMDQNSVMLMKIEEESKSALRRSSSEVRRDGWNANTSPSPHMKSICIQTEHEKDGNESELIKRLEKSCSIIPQTSTDTRNHQSLGSSTASNIKTDDSASSSASRSIMAGSPTVSVGSPNQTFNETKEWTNTTENSFDREATQEMDIDDDVHHQKDPSTDSAVCIFESNHPKDLSNDSTEMENLQNESLKEASQSEEYLPPPPEELLNDDEANIKDFEKEKTKRAINRRKSKIDPKINTSRNNSCVSTDSTTSTATLDSGIVLRSELSPRTSPLSGEQYYENKADIMGSRDGLDAEVAELNNNPNATSTPDRSQMSVDGDTSYCLPHQDSADSPLSENITSKSSTTRNDNFDVMSPRMEELDSEKTKLVESMREKINELRDQEQEIGEEIRVNEDLGKKVRNMVESKATQSEFSKFELFIGELNKIVALLLSLTQRLHRYESMLQDLDMSNEEDRAKKDSLQQKIEKLKSQHEEACYLRDVNDKRGDNVAAFLEKYCSEEEFADFQYYVDMKSQLALMQSEIREKVKLGEERLKALEQTGNEWGFS